MLVLNETDMQDDDLYDYQDLPAEPDQPAEPDPNSLGAILAKALKSIEEVGGRDRAQLRDLVGQQTYDLLLSKPRVAGAIDSYLSASPGTKRAAGRMLAMHIARSTDHPEVLDRIERELHDTFADGYAPPIVRRASARGQELQKITAQQRSGQRVADPDLLELAKRENISAYRNARLNPRGQQRQHRHGI
jgi:hypothetical protein